MNSINISKHGNRFSACGNWYELLELAKQKIAAGERVRLNVAWNHSFHDPYYTPFVIFGTAVHHPMDRFELDEKARMIENEYCQRFQYSRKSE